eukprot:12759-Heterococcus_DN1.PRE.4
MNSLCTDYIVPCNAIQCAARCARNNHVLAWIPYICLKACIRCYCAPCKTNSAHYLAAAMRAAVESPMTTVLVLQSPKMCTAHAAPRICSGEPFDARP